MSTKYHVSHKVRFGRGRSNYPARLSARGLSKSPHLAEIEGPSGLRARQERRVREGFPPWRVFTDETPAKVAAQSAPTDQPEAGLTARVEKLARHYSKAA